MRLAGSSPPANADLVATEDLAQLVADEIDDGLEAQRRGHALLDAGDHRQFAGALLGLRLRGAGLGRALFDLALQRLGGTQVQQRHCRLRGQQRQQLRVAVVEAAEGAVDVSVEEAEQLALGQQRHNEAAALGGELGTFGAVAQAGGAAAAGFREPGRDGLEQRRVAFAARQQRAGDATLAGRVEHQQHAVGA